MDGLARAYDANPDVKTFLFIRGDDRTPDKTPLAPGVPEALGGTFGEVAPINLSLAASCPDKRDFVVRETVAAAEPSCRQCSIASLPPRYRRSAICTDRGYRRT